MSEALHSASASAAADEALAELIAEITDRLHAGESVDIAEYAARCPGREDELRRLLTALEGLDGLKSSPEPDREDASAADAGPPEPSRTLGDFRIVRELGHGGMGVVYEAEQLSLGRRVALKVLPLAAVMDPRYLQRFHNEARAAASLHHEHIVPVYAVGSERGVHFYAMQLIDGLTLAQFLERQRGGGAAHRMAEPTTAYGAAAAPSAETAPQARASTVRAPGDAAYFRRVAEWGVQAAEALEHAHQLGIVHRDIKPGNLMLDAQGKLWVTDFGLARLGADTGLTRTGDLVGTLRYMSPEQALAKRVVIDHRTDLYSLGVTVYELLAGEPAVRGQTREEILRHIVFTEPKPPRHWNKAVPRDLETIILKAMAQEPERRYATAQELADDLRRFLDDRPVQARRPTAVQRARRWARRNRALVGALAAGLVLALVVLAGSVGWVLRDRAARQAIAEEKVREALAVLEPGLRKGNLHAPDVVRAARQAEAHLGGGPVGPELRQRAGQLLADLAMLVKLERTRMNWSANRAFDPWGSLAHAGVFREYGIDVEVLGVPEAAARIRGRVIATHLVAALEEWALVKRSEMQIRLRYWPPELDQERDQELAKGCRRPLEVAQAADPAADKWRAALREELARGGRRQALKKLVRAAPAAELPAVTLTFLARTLQFGDYYEDPGDAALAARLLREGARRHPADFWLNHELARALTQTEPPELDEAIGFCRAALALRPGDAWVYFTFGNALKGRGRFDDAIAAYREAIRLGKYYANAHRNLGSILARTGRWDEAAAEFRQAISFAPTSGPAHNDFGVALANNGQLDEAIAEFGVAVRCNSHDALAQINLGRALKERGYFLTALRHLRRGHELGSRSLGWNYPSAQWVADCQRLVDYLDAGVSAAVKGQEESVQSQQRLAYARHCQQTERLCASARFYWEAFALDPALADDFAAANRYHAGCVAALAGMGRSRDAAAVNETERASWRRQALDWLRADLKAYRQLMDESAGKASRTIAHRRDYRLNGTYLDGVRGPGALGKLPEAERTEWARFWQEVEALRQQAAAPARRKN